MALIVITGGARSGKSSAAVRLAEAHGGDVWVAVAGRPEGDPEMARRVARHRADRPAHWVTMEVAGEHIPTWFASIPDDVCLVIDCLGTLVAERVFGTDGHDPGPWVSEALEQRAAEVTEYLAGAALTRNGDTIVVTNEVGLGVVPMSASGRLFRDTIGRANARLVAAADAAYLCVCGRCLDLTALPELPSWPVEEAR